MQTSISYKNYFDVLINCPLFEAIPQDKINETITFLHGKTKFYRKGEFIVNHGDPFHYAGIILSGKIEISYTDNQFHKLSMIHFIAPDVFGEALALKKISYSPIQVEAVSDSIILFIDLHYLLVSEECCCSACAFNHRLLLNLTNRIVTQNLFSNLKLRILSQKTLRDKILIYLQSIQPDAVNVRTIPFSQTTLAEFLSVNRSALSRELGRMQDEGILQVDGRRYIIKM